MAKMNKSGLPPQPNFLIRAKRSGGGGYLKKFNEPAVPNMGSATAPHKTDIAKFSNKHGWPDLGKF